MLGRDIGAFLTGLIVIAVVFVLVRPNSNGPAFVKAIGAAIANVLTAASGGSPQPAGGTATGTAGGGGSPATGTSPAPVVPGLPGIQVQ